MAVDGGRRVMDDVAVNLVLALNMFMLSLLFSIQRRIGKLEACMKMVGCDNGEA